MGIDGLGIDDPGDWWPWGLGSGYRLRRPNQSGANAPSENYGFFVFKQWV
jgi:hypothetical protein